MKKIQLQVKPFSSFWSTVENIPTLIQEYLEAKDITIGEFFKLVKDGKSENTGYGMSYFDRLRIFYKNDSEPIYNTDYLLYRPGAPFSTDRWDLCIDQVKLLKETSDEVIYGFRNGTGQAFVKKSDKNGNIITLLKFDLEAREKALANQKEPVDKDTFKEWVYRYINRERMHCDIYHDDENLCVVVARHCHRSADPAHDWYQILIWKKAEGVAMSEHFLTYASSPSFNSSNYLRGKISINDSEEVIYDGKSEYGDVTVSQCFVLMS